MQKLRVYFNFTAQEMTIFHDNDDVEKECLVYDGPIKGGSMKFKEPITFDEIELHAINFERRK